MTSFTPEAAASTPSPSIVDQIASNYGFVLDSVVNYNRKHGGVLTADECFDAAGEAVTKALAKADRYDPSLAPLKAFLWTIARNEAVNAIVAKCALSKRFVPLYLKNRDSGCEYLNPAVEGLEDYSTGSGRSLDEREDEQEALRRERVRACAVAKLGLRDQFILHSIEDGRPYDDIAADLGIENGVLRKAVHDARKRAKAILSQSDYLDNDLIDFMEE